MPVMSHESDQRIRYSSQICLIWNEGMRSAYEVRIRNRNVYTA